MSGHKRKIKQLSVEKKFDPYELLYHGDAKSDYFFAKIRVSSSNFVSS